MHYLAFNLNEAGVADSQSNDLPIMKRFHKPWGSQSNHDAMALFPPLPTLPRFSKLTIYTPFKGLLVFPVSSSLQSPVFCFCFPFFFCFVFVLIYFLAFIH